MKQIQHRGEVRSVEPGMVHVAIVASSACHSCAARQVCGMSESTEKIIDVRCSSWQEFKAGDVVTVGEEQRMGTKAVLIAYVGAFLAMMLVLVTAILLGAGEGVSALLSLLAVVLYYFVVYLLRDKFEHTINFTITKS
ncbi:MAG: SoxR reducing system RseC family protein [Alistipes sp.]|nr:SoxR reducing system RseC family protein [Alistipes sp.]